MRCARFQCTIRPAGGNLRITRFLKLIRSIVCFYANSKLRAERLCYATGADFTLLGGSRGVLMISTLVLSAICLKAHDQQIVYEVSTSFDVAWCADDDPLSCAGDLSFPGGAAACRAYSGSAWTLEEAAEDCKSIPGASGESHMDM